MKKTILCLMACALTTGIYAENPSIKRKAAKPKSKKELRIDAQKLKHKSYKSVPAKAAKTEVLQDSKKIKKIAPSLTK